MPPAMPGEGETPHPKSLAATNRSALDLVSNLRGILAWFDCIRAADRDKPPDPKPSWWDGYATSQDWRIYIGPGREVPNRHDRITFTRRGAEQAINFLLARMDGHEEKWKILTEALPIAPANQSRFAACKSSLRNLAGMLSGAQMGDRLHYCVVPEEWHIAHPMPGIWTPEPETEEERTEQDRVEAVFIAALRRKGKDKSPKLSPAEKRKITTIRKDARRIRDARLARNEAAAEQAAKDGRITPEQHEWLGKLREHWRHEIKRWRLGEADIRALIAWLEAKPGKGAAGSAARADPEAESDAIDDFDLALLAFLNKRPTLRRRISEISPAAGPQDRKAIGARVRKLHRLGYLDCPPGSRSGAAILPKGVEALRPPPR